MEQPIKAGKINMGKGKSKRKKNYAKLYKASATGLSRLEIYDDEKSSTKGMTSELIVCGNIVKINHDYPGSSKSEFLFAVTTKDNDIYVFGVQSTGERDSWVKDLQSILFKGQQNSSQSSRVSVRHNTITDNDIYDSAEEYVRDHRVKISEETAKRLALQAHTKVKLLVEGGNITIINKENLVGRWGIEHLRRFGYSDNDFHFEAGRKSELGPGLFSFNTDKGKSIHMMVQREKKECRVSRMNLGETEPAQASAVQDSYNDFDGSTYEELSVTQQNSHKPNKGVIPQKPSRHNMEPSSPTTKPPGFYSNINNSAQVYADVTPHQNAWQNHGREIEDEDKSIYEDQVYDYDHTQHTTTTDTEDTYSLNPPYSGEQTEDPKPNIEQLYAVVNKKK